MLARAQYDPSLPSRSWKARFLPGAVVPLGLSWAGLSLLMAAVVGTGLMLGIGLGSAAVASGLVFLARLRGVRIDASGIQQGSRLYPWEQLRGAGAMVRYRGGSLSGLWFDFAGQRIRVSLSPLDREQVHWLSALAAPTLLASVRARRDRARTLSLGSFHLDAHQLKDPAGQSLPFERLGRISVSLRERTARFIVQAKQGKPFLELP